MTVRSAGTRIDSRPSVSVSCARARVQVPLACNPDRKLHLSRHFLDTAAFYFTYIMLHYVAGGK